MRFWPRRKDGSSASEASLDETRTLNGMGPTPETQRALSAARSAAVDLHDSRRLRAKIDEKADKIDAETSKNGFLPLIRTAFGSGP